MASKIFSIREHTLPCTHIREYPHATSQTQEDVLQLSIKQYTPHDNPHPQRGDITILGAHANGFPKELYEPLWIHLHAKLRLSNHRIRSIWIADVAHQNHSSVLNEDLLGNDPSWHDHARDLFLLTNHFRSEMPRPLIGIGHSMGGAHLASLSLMHPRLLSSLILIDPVISPTQGVGNWGPARASAGRRDIWPSRAAAASSYEKSPFYQAWHPHVLSLWLQFGLRDLPTALYADDAQSTEVALTPEPSVVPAPSRVTLATSRHQEVLTFVRRRPVGADGFLLPDADLAAVKDGLPFYRPEPGAIFARLEGLRPSVLFVFGDESVLSAPEERDRKLAVTGSGVGGSGGKRQGMVKGVVLKTGHLVPMEKPEETAGEATGWITEVMARWWDEERRVEESWEGRKGVQRSMMSDEFVRELKGDWAKDKAKL